MFVQLYGTRGNRRMSRDWLVALALCGSGYAIVMIAGFAAAT